MRVALLRHPPTSGGAGLAHGRLDLALVPGWEDRMPDLGGFRPQVLWTSPQPRCAGPAGWLGRRLGLAPRADARLCELDFGAWEGRPWDEVERAALDRWASDPLGFAPPGGESGAALLARVAGFAAELAAAGQDAVVVTHGGPLRLLPDLLRRVEWPEGPVPALLAPPPAPGSVTWIEAAR